MGVGETGVGETGIPLLDGVSWSVKNGCNMSFSEEKKLQNKSGKWL